jgi:S-adenosyl methyltransferase
MIVLDVRANRKFLTRIVEFLAVERGIRQFLDIGTGRDLRSHRRVGYREKSNYLMAAPTRQ